MLPRGGPGARGAVGACRAQAPPCGRRGKWEDEGTGLLRTGTRQAEHCAVARSRRKARRGENDRSGDGRGPRRRAGTGLCRQMTANVLRAVFVTSHANDSCSQSAPSHRAAGWGGHGEANFGGGICSTRGWRRSSPRRGRRGQPRAQLRTGDRAGGTRFTGCVNPCLPVRVNGPGPRADGSCGEGQSPGWEGAQTPAEMTVSPPPAPGLL